MLEKGTTSKKHSTTPAPLAAPEVKPEAAPAPLAAPAPEVKPDGTTPAPEVKPEAAPAPAPAPVNSGNTLFIEARACAITRHNDLAFEIVYTSRATAGQTLDPALRVNRYGLLGMIFSAAHEVEDIALFENVPAESGFSEVKRAYARRVQSAPLPLIGTEKPAVPGTDYVWAIYRDSSLAAPAPEVLAREFITPAAPLAAPAPEVKQDGTTPAPEVKPEAITPAPLPTAPAPMAGYVLIGFMNACKTRRQGAEGEGADKKALTLGPNARNEAEHVYGALCAVCSFIAPASRAENSRGASIKVSEALESTKKELEATKSAMAQIAAALASGKPLSDDMMALIAKFSA